MCLAQMKANRSLLKLQMQIKKSKAKNKATSTALNVSK